MASGWGRALGEPGGGGKARRTVTRLLCGSLRPHPPPWLPSDGYLPFRPLFINRAGTSAAHGSCPRPAGLGRGRGGRRRRRRGRRRKGSRPRSARLVPGKRQRRPGSLVGRREPRGRGVSLGLDSSSHAGCPLSSPQPSGSESLGAA